MSQTVSQNHAYLIRRNGIFYFTRRVPSDLQTRFNKERVTISLRTRSQAKAEKSAEALSDRLERYTNWDIGLNIETLNAYYYTCITQQELAEQNSETKKERKGV